MKRAFDSSECREGVGKAEQSSSVQEGQYDVVFMQ